MPFDPQTLALYPDQPGVYLMKDAKGSFLYIGKAKDLRARLKQYFTQQDTREMIPYLRSQIETIETIVVLSEKDALILENTLIKKHLPKYNCLLKDDKTFISLLMTSHPWPMLQFIRYKEKPKEKGTFFGPYTNALAARQTHDLILKMFPLRQCSDSEFASRTRPCLLYDIKKCCAPCVGKCTKEQYSTYVDGATRLLKGQDKEVIRDLKQKMEEASEALDFEKAKSFLQMIHQIEHVTSVQHVDNPYALNTDVIGLYREADAVMIALLLFREGKLVGSEHFSFHQILSSDAEILESFLLQHYKSLEQLPKEIFLPLELANNDSIEEIFDKKVKISNPKIGKKNDLLEMAFRNAKALFVREQDAKSLKEKQLIELQETLRLTRFPRRIECIDTSHISGADPVASLVTFINGVKDPSRMKRFKIKKTDISDDYSSMKEVLHRHFLKAKEENNFADLLIVDGGKGQLNLALDVFKQLNIASVDVIGVSKEDARHDKGLTQEKIFIPYQKEPILINPRSPLLFLLQKIRDEAHRVCIEYHRKKRSQRTISSKLDEIKGIGPIKKKRLLSHFKSVKAIQKASIDELKQIKGITQKDIEKIKKLPLEE